MREIIIVSHELLKEYTCRALQIFKETQKLHQKHLAAAYKIVSVTLNVLENSIIYFILHEKSLVKKLHYLVKQKLYDCMYEFDLIVSDYLK